MLRYLFFYVINVSYSRSITQREFKKTGGLKIWTTKVDGDFLFDNDSEMSEQLDMMGEFCYGPDAFKNSRISHSYVRVSF